MANKAWLSGTGVKRNLKKHSARKMRVREREVLASVMSEQVDADEAVFPVSREVEDLWNWD